MSVTSFKMFCKEEMEITKIKEQAAGLVKSKEGITLLSLKFCSKKSTSSVKKRQTRILYNLTLKNQRQSWWRQGPKSKQNCDSTFS